MTEGGRVRNLIADLKASIQRVNPSSDAYREVEQLIEHLQSGHETQVQAALKALRQRSW